MVSEVVRKSVTNISGATTTFTFSFRILESDDLLVYWTDTSGVTTLLTKDSNYSVVDSGGDGFASGGEVEIIDPAAGYDEGTLTIVAATDLTQTTQFVENQATPKSLYERTLDKLTMIAQELIEKSDRSILFPLSEIGSEDRIPASRSKTAFGFDENGDLQMTPYEGALISAVMQQFADDEDQATALTTLGLSAFMRGAITAASATTFLQTYLAISVFARGLLNDSAASSVLTELGLSAFMRGIVGQIDIAEMFESVVDEESCRDSFGIKSRHGFFSQKLFDGYSGPVGTCLSTIRWCGHGRVAWYNWCVEEIRMYEFDGASFTQLGASLDVSGHGSEWSDSFMVPFNITETTVDIAAYRYFDRELTVYHWNGSSWAESGTALNIPGMSVVHGCFIGDDKIVIGTSDNQEIRVYDFNGSTWSQVGNSFSVTDPSSFAGLNDTDIAVLDNTTLRLLRWDGSDFSEIASTDIGVSGTIVGCGRTDLVMSVGSTLRCYNFNGTNFEISSPESDPGSPNYYLMDAITPTTVLIDDVLSQSFVVMENSSVFDGQGPHRP